jgi:hypothetical protein
MQRPCHRCGFVSDRPTRFCRQCGAQLFAENEATSATTRQYALQHPANGYDAPYQSQFAQIQFAPDDRYGNQTPDTSRLYHDQMAPQFPSYPANHQQAVTKKSGALKWVLITLLCVALVSGGISAMVISAIRSQRPAPAEVDGEGRIGAPPPQAPPPPPSIRGVGLEQYKYPNAKMVSTVRAFGSESMTMTSGDRISDVRDYYKKRLGDPMVEGADRAVVFRIPGPLMTVITINSDEKDSGKTQITVVRTNLQIPK